MQDGLKPDRWALPEAMLADGQVISLWVEEGRLTSRPVGSAPRLPGNFASAGLVDAHIHIALGDQVPLGIDDAREKLRAARDQGVLLVRDMGAPGGISLELPPDPLLPRVVACGEQLAVEGGFFPDCHEPVPPDRLIEAALEQVARGATWVKVLTDWDELALTYPVDVLRAMVDAIHEKGARVAAHNQMFGVRDVVLAGVDSIEHGTTMDAETVGLMAERGVAWAPTACAVEEGLRDTLALLQRDDLSQQRRERVGAWLPIAQGYVDSHRSMIPLAASLGVTLLASTDNSGSVAEEVEWFVRYGVGPSVALAAATTGARRFLGASGLEDGAPADVVTFDEDPRQDVAHLRRPVAILLGGRRVL